MNHDKSSMEKICELTNDTLEKWENPWGYAPDIASRQLEKIDYSRIKNMTNELRYLHDRLLEPNEEVTSGGIIATYTILGALVEGWMVFLLSVFAADYKNDKFVSAAGKCKNLDELKFEQMITYFDTTVWGYEKGDKKNNIIQWMRKIKDYRNSIHIYKPRKIGNFTELYCDIDMYFEVLRYIIRTFPDDPISARYY